MVKITQPAPTKDDVQPGEQQKSRRASLPSLTGEATPSSSRRRFFRLTNMLGRRPVSASRQTFVEASPKELPLPHHGRPYLPYGVWIHVWTGTRINVTDPKGVYLSENMTIAKLPCPIGRPPVFLREMDRQAMTDLVKQGSTFDRVHGSPPMSGEDWRYWLDALDKSGTKKDFERKSVDEMVDRVAEKYDRLKTALQPFLEFVQQHPNGLEPVPMPGE